jgi:hypothetical protein
MIIAYLVSQPDIVTGIGHNLLVIIGGTPGTMNLLWGGFLSSLSELTLLGGLVAMYRKYNCHEPKCWRIGRHPVLGTAYTTCRRHNPHVPTKLRRGDIEKAYQAANGQGQT